MLKPGFKCWDEKKWIRKNSKERYLTKSSGFLYSFFFHLFFHIAFYSRNAYHLGYLWLNTAWCFPLKTSSSYTLLNRTPSPPLAWTSAQWDTCCSRSTESTLWMRASWSCYRSLSALQDQWHCGILDIPQRDSSHSRACTRACHWPSRIFLQLGCCHSQSSRSVSDANFGFLPEYTHCWISAHHSQHIGVSHCHSNVCHSTASHSSRNKSCQPGVHGSYCRRNKLGATVYRSQPFQHRWPGHLPS